MPKVDDFIDVQVLDRAYWIVKIYGPKVRKLFGPFEDKFSATERMRDVWRVYKGDGQNLQSWYKNRARDQK